MRYPYSRGLGKRHSRGQCRKIQARLVVEAANGPVTYAADEILRQRGITVIPDMLANADGVVVSYFEWVKNIIHMPYGLMERRQTDREHHILAHSMEKMTGQSFPSEHKGEFLAERGEIDLVRSGLAEMMHQAFGEVSTHAHQSRDGSTEVVLDFRSVCSLLKMDQGFLSGS